MVPETAESRAHPDKTRDVWELAVWDPLPISLQLFCLFSPGHVLVYMLFLPLESLDPRPSVTVFNAIALQVILSAQMMLLQTRFSQQIKDTAIIHKEVLHEYDTKFVHPRLHPVVRDVGTQASFTETEEDGDIDSVEIGTPTTIIKKEFHTHPNPNYVRHVDPDHVAGALHRQRVGGTQGRGRAGAGSGLVSVLLLYGIERARLCGRDRVDTRRVARRRGIFHRARADRPGRKRVSVPRSTAGR